MDIGFPNNRPLPGEPAAPVIDGVVEPEIPASTLPIDKGWASPVKVTYGTDAAVGDGRPLVDFQAVKHTSQDYLFFSFVVRRLAFTNDARIALVMDPGFNPGTPATSGQLRRIMINPVNVGSSDGENLNPPGGIRVEKWAFDGPTESWLPATHNAANFDAKVRIYTTGTSRNWSIEIKVPLTAALGGSDWWDVGSRFGFYFSLVTGVWVGAEKVEYTWPWNPDSTTQYSWTDPTGPLPADRPSMAFLESDPDFSTVVGVKFQNGANSIGVLNAGSITNQIRLGTSASPVSNQFVARLLNTGTRDVDVSAIFRIANWGIGPGEMDRWTLVPSDVGTPNPTSPVALPPTGGAGVPLDVTANWTLDDIERGQYSSHPHQCIWVQLRSPTFGEFVESSTRRNMNFVSLSAHREAAEISGAGFGAPAGSTGDQEFVLVVNQVRNSRLVEKKEAGTVTSRMKERVSSAQAFQGGEHFDNGKGYFGLLFTYLRKLFSNQVVINDWFWTADAYRKTLATVVDGGSSVPLYESVGSFGYIADHEGLVSKWVEGVTANASSEGRLQKLSDTVYKLTVPNNGKVTIDTRLEVKDFNLLGLFGFLLLLIAIITVIFAV